MFLQPQNPFPVGAKIRPAVAADARQMAHFVNMAGEGLPLHLWTKLAEPEQDPWEIGRQRALRESGGFSFRNTLIFGINGEPAGCLIGYRLPDRAEAIDYSNLPPMFAPLEELEALAAGTWYVNVLATAPHMRSRGIGSRLLQAAGHKAGETGATGLSIIVADANDGAMRLYERHGFVKSAARPMVKEDWLSDSREWILMKRMT